MAMSEAEALKRLENEVHEIKEMLVRLESILIGEEEISDEERGILKKRLKEARNGETVSLDELMRELDVSD